MSVGGDAVLRPLDVQYCLHERDESRGFNCLRPLDMGEVILSFSPKAFFPPDGFVDGAFENGSEFWNQRFLHVWVKAATVVAYEELSPTR